MPGASHGWSELTDSDKRELIRSIRTGNVAAGPFHAEIDLTDRCNVACYFCNQQDVRSSQYLSLGHLQQLIDEMAPRGLRSVRLSGGGDPLFHPDVVAFLKYLGQHQVSVDNVTTNGVLLDESVAQTLVDYGAREVIVSLNAASPSDYRRMMKSREETFDKVAANVKGLVSRRREGKLPCVIIQFLIDRINCSQLREMYRLGVELKADTIAIGVVSEIPLERIEPRLLLQDQDVDLVAPFLDEIVCADKEERRLQIHFPYPAWSSLIARLRLKHGYDTDDTRFPVASSFKPRNDHCFFSWYTVTIRGDGSVYPCCLLMKPDYKPLGKVESSGIERLWQGEVFQEYRREQRKALLEGERAVFDPKSRAILRQCVEPGACWLKNVYFRGDEQFYSELDRALAGARFVMRVRRALARLSRLARSCVRRILAASLR